MTVLQTISQTNWLQRWSGYFTFISCAYWGEQYQSTLAKILGMGFENTLFLHYKGMASFYVSAEEFNRFGKRMAGQSVKDPRIILKYCRKIKKSTDILTPLMKRMQRSIPSYKDYQKFLSLYAKHLAYHSFVKKTVDFLPVNVLEDMLPKFTDARLYSESIYTDSEIFFRNLMKLIAKREHYNKDWLTCLTAGEFETYLKRRGLPLEKILKARFNASVLYFHKGKFNILLGNQVTAVEKALLKLHSSKNKELFGISAFPGKIRGTCRVILDTKHVKRFDEGDILVTGMTRPEYSIYFKKSAAVVTESGGVLSHAAITARELKKPCVVGTQIATKILRDGDKVEVNATKGVVRIL
jgi:phosphohistidine swiveling domain-containing protein